MKLIEHIERINRLHEMIKYCRTGTPQQLGRRLNLSTSMVYKLLEELKLRDAPIEYSRQMGSYYYSKKYLMRIHMDFRLLKEEEEANYDGGLNRKINIFFSLL